MPLGSLQRALLIAGAYFAIAIAYIVSSSRLAALLAPSIGDLQRVETLKGMGFVAVTAIGVFVATRSALVSAERTAAELQRQRDALVATERQALAGMMAATVAHDANNALTALLGMLETIHPSERDARAFEIARSSALRLVDLNRRLASAAKSQAATDRRAIALGPEVQEIVVALRLHRAVRGCTVRVDVADGLAPLTMSPVLLQQVVTNLVVNAAEATGGKGTVEVRLAQDGEHVTIEVHDDGPGVPVEKRADLFAALHTTKPAGTGLGLYSARACVTAGGGTLTVGDSPLGGACFRVTLPR